MINLDLRSACTILMPVYNGEKFLQKTIVNLIALTSQQDEILIINDGSIDGTAEILQNLVKIYPKITVEDLPHTGIVNALNVGLSISKYPYIARADVDDSYSLARIETQIRSLEQDTSIAAVFSDYSFLSEDGDYLGHMPSAVNWKATALSLSSGVRTAHPSVMFRRDSVLSVGGYRESEFPAEDLGLWIRLSKEFKLVSVPQELLRYTINMSGITNTKSVEMRKKREELLLKLDYKKLIADNIDDYAAFRKEYRDYSFQHERLALHNLELLLVIFKFRREMSVKSSVKLASQVFFRILNPKIEVAIFRLFRERNRRKKSNMDVPT